MAYKKNSTRFDLIQRFGETVDLPLFEQKAEAAAQEMNTEKLPRRVFDGTAIKAEAIAFISHRLSASRERVLRAIIELGRATDREIAVKLRWDINRVIPRRKELQGIKLVQEDGTKEGEFGLKNIAWAPDWRGIKELLRAGG